MAVKKFLSVELRVSIRFLQHLHSNWDTLLYYCSSLVYWKVLLLSPINFFYEFAVFFDNIDHEMSTIVQRAHGDYPKFFVA